MVERAHLPTDDGAAYLVGRDGPARRGRRWSAGSPCDIARVIAVAAPLPVVLLVVTTATDLSSVVAAVLAVCAAAATAAVVTRRCAQRRVRDHLDRHQRELEHTKRQILSLVSHELRTPVTGVVGFSRTLSGRLDQLDHETLRLFVDAIDEHSNRLARLIDNVVVASRTPSTAGGVSRLSSALSRALGRVSLCPTQMQRLRITLDGSLQVRIDEEAAVRVLANLIDNAIKFGDPDEDVIIAGRRSHDRIVLDVANAGPALPLDLRRTLYEPFVQGDATDSRGVDGLGLGLFVVRQLVEAYGGGIDLVDHPRLVVFRVSLPAVGAVGAVEPDPEPRAADGRGGGLSPVGTIPAGRRTIPAATARPSVRPRDLVR